MTLIEIEKEFDLKYPLLYKQLEQDGMLDVGEYGHDWYNTIFPKLKENPTLFLHSDDFELLNIKGVHEAIKELSDPEDYRQINPELKLIPFGQSGSGDHYCFFLNEQHGEDIPIVLVWHDSNEVQYLAKNLQDYIFRVLLTDMSEQDIYNNVSDEEFRANLENVFKTHSKYLTAQQNEILKNIISREIINYEIELPRGRKEAHRGLLSYEELKKIMAEVIPYQKADTSFEYAAE